MKFKCALQIIIVGILFICNPSVVIGKQDNMEEKIEKLQKNIKQISQSIDEVRRDQLNYRLEKNLLKEAYSSNLETINIIIILILGAFAIIGYLGVKGISTIKSDFKNELEKLEKLRMQFEGRIKEVDAQLEGAKQTKEKLEGLAAVNVEQDKRLQILEIQEKASSFINGKNYVRALEYIKVGLGLSEKDPLLLDIKALCLMKLGKLKDAQAAYEIAEANNPGRINILSNILELSILNKKHDDARSLNKANAPAFLKTYGPYFDWYIMALDYFLSGNVTQLKKHISKQPIENPQERSRRIEEQWGYEEAISVIQTMESQPGYQDMVNTINFLKGDLGLTEFNKSTSQAD